MSNVQLNKLKSGIKNGTDVTFSWNLIEISNNEINSPHKLLLTDTKISNIRKACANGSSVNIKSSKTQLSKIIQSGAVIRGIPIFGNILSSVAKKEQTERET